MPVAYTGPIPPVSHLPRDRTRPSLALRLRVRWNAAQLDAALAGGADPGASKALALRAQQLREPRHRARIANSIHQLVDLAQRSRAAHLSLTGVPFRPERVVNSGPQLLELADRLEAIDAPPTKGLAMANLLVEDGSGALYAHEPSDPIRPAVEAVLAALRR